MSKEKTQPLETPALDYLLAAYFHQDWMDIEGQTVEAVVNRFVDEEDQALAAAVRDEAAGWLRAGSTKHGSAVRSHDHDVDVAVVGGYEAWLTRVLAYLEKRLANAD